MILNLLVDKVHKCGGVKAAIKKLSQQIDEEKEKRNKWMTATKIVA
jgi:hypothetical protein